MSLFIKDEGGCASFSLEKILSAQAGAKPPVGDGFLVLLASDGLTADGLHAGASRAPLGRR